MTKAVSQVGDKPTPARTLVPPVQRALRLLRHIADGDPVTVPSRTAKDIGINRTTLGRLLATLEDEGMIERTNGSGGSGYGLGPEVRKLGARALFSTDMLQIADPILVELAADLKLSSHLAVLDGQSVVYVLRRVPNSHLVSNVQIGSRLDAYSVNAGRIILANLPKSEVTKLFANVKFLPATPKTPKSLKELLVQLQLDLEAGLSWSDSNFEVGISSVAAAVFNHIGQVVAAVNVTGPTAAYDTTPTRRTEIGDAISAAAAEISHQLGYLGQQHKLHKS